MKRAISLIALLIVLAAFTVTGAGCTTTCETYFGQEPPLMRGGVKYWPSTCKPSYLYKEPEKPAPAVKK